MKRKLEDYNNNPNKKRIFFFQSQKLDLNLYKQLLPLFKNEENPVLINGYPQFENIYLPENVQKILGVFHYIPSETCREFIDGFDLSIADSNCFSIVDMQQGGQGVKSKQVIPKDTIIGLHGGKICYENIPDDNFYINAMSPNLYDKDPLQKKEFSYVRSRKDFFKKTRKILSKQSNTSPLMFSFDEDNQGKVYYFDSDGNVCKKWIDELTFNTDEKEKIQDILFKFFKEEDLSEEEWIFLKEKQNQLRQQLCVDLNFFLTPLLDQNKFSLADKVQHGNEIENDEDCFYFTENLSTANIEIRTLPFEFENFSVNLLFQVTKREIQPDEFLLRDYGPAYVFTAFSKGQDKLIFWDRWGQSTSLSLFTMDLKMINDLKKIIHELNQSSSLEGKEESLCTLFVMLGTSHVSLLSYFPKEELINLLKKYHFTSKESILSFLNKYQEYAEKIYTEVKLGIIDGFGTSYLPPTDKRFYSLLSDIDLKEVLNRNDTALSQNELFSYLDEKFQINCSY